MNVIEIFYSFDLLNIVGLFVFFEVDILKNVIIVNIC